MMSDVPQWLISTVLGAGLTVCGWFLRGLYESLHELTKTVHAIEVDVAKNYVPNERYDKTITALFDKLDRIEDKIDGKVDKKLTA